LKSTNQISEILKLENQICFPLYAAARVIVQAYGPMMKQLQLTYPQYLILLVLWEKNNLSVTEIGEKLFLDSGTLTPLLKKMQVAGWVSRKRSTLDDRQVLNCLTKKAEKLKATAAGSSYELFCKSGIQLQQAQELRTSLNQLLKLLSKQTEH
jgi:DNA-binding MarR family transcriptional regulator